MDLKKSIKREKILELVQGTDSHPTATWVYDRLKEEYPDLSLGTVYRNLNILVEQGKIKKIDFGSTFDRFDPVSTPHYHFICEKCGSITDLKMPVNEALNKTVSDATSFTITRHRTEFYGICDRCR